MSKPGQAQFDRVKPFEEAFKNRYGKDVEVYRAITLSESGKIDTATVHIIYKGKKYFITEKLNEEQLTEYVMSGEDNKPHRYNTYLEAEVFVADLIGDNNG